MSLKYFGTDGIRGVVDSGLDTMLAYNVGKSIAHSIKQKGLTAKVIIGKDTRISGDTLSLALACGICDYGVDVVFLGIVPTACVSYLSSKLDVGYGVMLTASHNTPDMNGIKIINNMGYKLEISHEKELESYIDDNSLKPSEHKGNITYNYEMVKMYVNHIKNIGTTLSGLKIALDCANGSNYIIAPAVFRALGAQVVEINTDNNGAKINLNCGALHPENLKNEVLTHKCDIGFAFDGDADRLVIVTSSGFELGGDELLYLFAKYLKESNELNSLCVVGTQLTNKGCEISLQNEGIKLVRVDVGDRNVIEKMHQNNYSLGGETSGHICLHKYNTTCDALMNALLLLKIINGNFDKINEMLLPYKKQIQIIKNISVDKEFRKQYNDNKKFLDKLNVIINTFENCKIIVRPSGTESVIRIFAESEDVNVSKKAVEVIEEFIKTYIKNNY